MKELKYHILSIANAEKISFIGDSYTESHFSVEGKAYICKLSLFSDYNYENFAKSGDTYRGNLDRLRKEDAIYHDVLSWKDIKPKYAFLVSYTNDLKYMDEEQYFNDLRAVIETVKGLGAIPIIATEYHSNFGAGLQVGLRQVAREYDCEVVDILDVVDRVRGEDYKPFWSGTHPGTRANHILSDNFEVYLERLPRPRQSLKIFRSREVFTNVENLIFNTNEERARLFKEINVGHNALAAPSEVDEVTSAQHEPVESEYLKLQNGHAIGFNDVALVSAVLPSTSLGLEYVALDLGDYEGSVYVKDICKAPYPTPTFYQRFDIEKDSAAAVGDVYVSDNPHFEGIQFTIKEVSDEAVLALPYPRIATNVPGKLTKVSGEGLDEINYPYTAIGFANDYPRGKAKVGHYVEIKKVNGKYVIPKELLGVVVDYDKIHFVLVNEGTFSIDTINVEWAGIENKVYQTKSLKPASPKGKTLMKWESHSDIQNYIPEDQCLPKGSKGCKDIDPHNVVSQHVSYEELQETREVRISIVARYFPEIFKSNDDYEKCAITLNSYDYRTLCIDMIFGEKVFTQKMRVGLHWKEVNLDTILPAYTSEVTLKVYTECGQLQLASVSLREM